MNSSLTDVLLTPIERPRCVRCRTRMDLTSIAPRTDGTEKRTFECANCAFIETKIASDPLDPRRLVRMASHVRPPA